MRVTIIVEGLGEAIAGKGVRLLLDVIARATAGEIQAGEQLAKRDGAVFLLGVAIARAAL